MKLSEYGFAGVRGMDWTATLWLSTFREFVGYSSKLCGLRFATSLAINQLEVILKAPLMETHM